MPGYTRDELLALTPARYLADGYLDEAGHPRSGLTGDFATAATTRLLAADMPVQELAFTFEAWRLLLQGQEGAPAGQARAALDEALATVVRMIRQPNNKGLVTWLGECVAAIRQPGDIDALLLHMRSVLRLATVIASLPEPEPDLSSDVSSPDPTPA